MADSGVTRPFFFGKYWALSIAFVLLVTMISTIRFGTSVLKENRNLFLNASALRLGQSQSEVEQIMGKPDATKTIQNFTFYCYGGKQRKLSRMLSLFNSKMESATNRPEVNRTKEIQFLNQWPVAICFSGETEEAIRIKKGSLIIR